MKILSVILFCLCVGTIVARSPLVGKGTEDYPTGYFQFLPRFVDYLYDQSPISATTTCFEKIVFEFRFNTTDINQPASLTVDAFQKEERNCTGWFAISSRESWHRFSIPEVGEHEVSIPEWSEGEIEDVQKHGWMLFEIPDGIIGSLEDLVVTLELFGGDNMTANNVEMTEEYFQVKLQERPENRQWNVTLTKEQIKSGDYFAVRKWNGLGPVIMIGTGGFTTHTAIALWMDNDLYVCESTGETSDWPPPYGIIKTPYDQWIQQNLEIHSEIAVLRLSDEKDKKFNQNIDKAIQFFKDNEGYPYGYHNFIFGWIDTIESNYPFPLDKEILIPLFLHVESKSYETANSLWLLGLNMRLGTDGLSLSQILDVCEERGIDFFELMSWSEQDEWVYPDGPSMVCDVFVMAVYKAAGLFDDTTVQVTEFTPRDSYQINFYDSNWVLPPSCLDDGLPFCQLMGQYLLELPGFNTISVYDNMFEKCGALPHEYTRTPEIC